MQRHALKISSPAGSTELSPTTPYIDFDLELTEEEKASLEELNISSQSTYMNYDHLSSLLDDANKFISQIGKNNAEISLKIAALIVRIVNQTIAYFQEHFQKETAIVEMRSFQPNPAFRIPRWHQDGPYFSSENEAHYKAVVTLKGPSTLFYNPSQEQKEFMAQLVREEESSIPVDASGQPDYAAAFQQAQKTRIKLAKTFDKSQAVSPAAGVGSIFIAGTDYAAVHSEPDITSPRFFVSITPGNKAQIKQREENQQSIAAVTIKL